MFNNLFKRKCNHQWSETTKLSERRMEAMADMDGFFVEMHGQKCLLCGELGICYPVQGIIKNPLSTPETRIGTRKLTTAIEYVNK